MGIHCIYVSAGYFPCVRILNVVTFNRSLVCLESLELCREGRVLMWLLVVEVVIVAALEAMQTRMGEITSLTMKMKRLK
jgi:hypothetical protein